MIKGTYELTTQPDGRVALTLTTDDGSVNAHIDVMPALFRADLAMLQALAAALKPADPKAGAPAT